MNLRLLAAKYALGMLLADDLPGIATDLLVDGVESQSLACLAASVRSDAPADRRELFEAALKECATTVPGRLEAAQELKIQFAEQVARHELDPVRGAAKIVDLYYAVEALLPKSKRHPLESFGIADLFGFYCSLDDIEGDDSLYADIEGDIARACRRIAETATG